MALIQHRVNALVELEALPVNRGVEIDLRSFSNGDVSKTGTLQLSHDPWQPGPDFEDWLKVFSQKPRGPLIVNTKEDGLEARCQELLKKYHVSDYFFLDTTIPTLVRLTKSGLRDHLCVRYSRYEPTEFLALWAGQVKWVWLDCFGGNLDFPISRSLLEKFSICLVSPELQGAPVEAIAAIKEKVQGLSYSVCTKRPELWEL